MPIDLRHLRVFHTIADERSFRKAAQKLHIAQPALTRTIQNLEALLGVDLFIRTTRSLTLSDAGKTFLKHTQTLFEDLDHAITLTRQTQQGQIGELRIGYNDFAINGLLPDIVRLFRLHFPRVSLRLYSTESNDMVRKIQEERLELALHTMTAGTSLPPELNHVVMRHERLVLLVPDSHPLAKRASVSFQALRDEPFIMGNADSWSVFIQPLREAVTAQGSSFQVIQESDHSDGIIRLVASELGVAFYVDSEWLHVVPGIRVIPIDTTQPDFQTLITWKTQRENQSPAIGHFLQHARALISDKGDRCPINASQ